MDHDDPRPNPEMFLAEANAEAGNRVPRGRLKIFIGASPGVGKTYAMLEEARAVEAAGTDVVVALAETHGRAETAALLSHLDQIPRRMITYRGRQLSEMDLDAVLARRPQLALIDELAHTNVPGARHPKRWQDVEEVLAAGIDVYTTLNIQHIESLNDVVARITGVRVQETVPDAILQRADEIRMIDLPAEDLIKRMREGKVYMPNEAGRALVNFFSKPNLTALRELALRTAASRVDAEVLALSRDGARMSSDRLMVCLDDPASAMSLVRAGRRMTDRARIPWIVASAITPEIERQGVAASGQMTDALALAQRLGAEIRVLHTEKAEIADEMLALARRLKASRLIVGRGFHHGWFGRLKAHFVPSLSERILDRATEFEVTVLATTPEPPARRPISHWMPRGWPRLLAESLIVTTVCTLVTMPFNHLLPVASLAVVYLVGVLAIGMRRGTTGAVMTSILSFLAYNFFFTMPFFSLKVATHDSIVALLVFTISALFTGSLAGRLKRQVEFMRVTQERTETLYDFARKIASASTTDDVLWAAAAHIARSLECHSLILMPDQLGMLRQVQGFPSIEEELDSQSEAAALWAYKRNAPAGAGTETLPSGDWMFVPLATQGAPIGAIGMRFMSTARRDDPETRRLLTAVEDQVAVAVERIKFESDLERARISSETEKLRAALLNSVSHDLRTPLVTVIGALSAVTEGDLPPERQAALLQNGLDEALRLDRYVGNLLSMTRLGHGALKPRRVPVEVAELVSRAIADLTGPLAGFQVRQDLPSDLPAIMVDPVLIGQALVNLMENASKYAPEGSTIRVSATPLSDAVELIVEDDGPGIALAERERVFDLFHRAIQGDGQPAGTGLGLAIVKGLVEANEGSVSAIDPPSLSGAAFRIVLPSAPATRLAAEAGIDE